ncbi:MAG: RluA family pseudouridine synthase [Rhodospirillales bacterium]|nr:RluA family pseudouridine synthase [Rhodospirillales bacterium]
MTTRMREFTYTLRVPQDKAGARLDRFLAEAIDGISRSRLKQLIVDGHVSRRDSAGPVIDPSLRVKGGQEILVFVPAPVAAEPMAQDIPLSVIYEDDHLIVIDKPSGLVVHPAAGHADGTLVNALLAHCGDSLSGIGGVSRPGIVHRLDKDTSGLMVIAKSDASHRGLAEQFHDHDLERAYYALVWGTPAPRSGEIEGNIGRSPANRKKMAVLRRGGKTALTRYRVIRTMGTLASLVRCDLATGRTHQIRVHMAHRGHPVLGDPLYGGGGRSRLRGARPAAVEAVKGLDSQALHAFLIGFRHPISGENMRFETEIPLYFNELGCELDRE